MSKQEFIASLQDSEKSFRAAIANEERHGFEFEDTLERKYEEGFIDGMRHAYMLLTGDVPEGAPSGSIERETRDAIKAHQSNPLTGIEEHRAKWAKVARENGWYHEPFFVQVWIDPEYGEIYDSVATRELTGDIVVWEAQDA